MARTKATEDKEKIYFSLAGKEGNIGEERRVFSGQQFPAISFPKWGNHCLGHG